MLELLLGWVARVKVKIGTKDGAPCAFLSGNIDESCTGLFEEIAAAASSPPRLQVDCKDVAHINSIGVARWMLSLEQLPPTVLVVFQNCPSNMIGYASVIRNFFGRHAIGSFYLSYQCGDCSALENPLFRTAEVISQGRILPGLGARKCVACGGEALSEPDIEDVALALRNELPSG